MASRWAPGVAEPSGPVMALPPRAMTTREVTLRTLAPCVLAVKYPVSPRPHRRSGRENRFLAARSAIWSVGAGSARVGRRGVVARADRALQPSDVVPHAVLPADAPVDPHGLEAERPVQALAGGVGQRHPGEQHPVAAGLEPVEQRLVERPARAAAP